MNVSSGSSSGWVLNDLRHVLGLNSTRYDQNFIYPSDLTDFTDNTDTKKVVFVDDMIGSGKSVIDFWDNVKQNYNPKNKYFIATLIGYQKAINNIQKGDKKLKIITASAPLPDECKIFNENNLTFSDNEKSILKKYCTNVANPGMYSFGFGNTQSTIVFYTRAPNNTLPILYSKRNGWFPLFPRDGARF